MRDCIESTAGHKTIASAMTEATRISGVSIRVARLGFQAQAYDAVKLPSSDQGKPRADRDVNWTRVEHEPGQHKTSWPGRITDQAWRRVYPWGGTSARCRA